MRTQILSSGKIVGGLLASAVLAMSFSSVSFAGTSIYGTPSTSVTATRYYGFQTWATDTDQKSVAYSIKNKPSWATFDARYGHLYGIPSASSVGTYSNIVITASDGVSSASLPAFAITVKSNGSTGTTSGSGSGGGSGSGSGGTTSSSGSVTVNWTPPTLNTNGSALTNLAGYTISYGTSASNRSSTVKVATTGVTSYVIDNLSAGTYYFGVTAYSSAGQTSTVSNVVSKTIN
jgi:Fibronectin type III domain